MRTFIQLVEMVLLAESVRWLAYTRTMEKNAGSCVTVAKHCVMYHLDVFKVRISLYFFLLVIGRMFKERKRKCLNLMEKTTT